MGNWREEHFLLREGRLFGDILVVLSGSLNDPYTLDLSIKISQEEGSRLSGLYFTKPNTKNNSDFRIGHYQRLFNDRCKKANISGELAIIFAQNPIDQIIRRTRFANLVLFSNRSRLFQNIRLSKLIQNCPAPIIVVNGEAAIPFTKSLCIYDGSSETKEALRIAVYMAKNWGVDPVVLLIETKRNDPMEIENEAGELFSRFGIKAAFIEASGRAEMAITISATKEKCDLIILGGTSANIFKRKVSGSIVDSVITRAKQPVLICNSG